MAQDFIIAGINMPNIVKGDWDQAVIQSTLQGEQIFPNQVRHFWKASILTTQEFAVFDGLEGFDVDIVTTDFFNPNGDYRLYQNCMLERSSGVQVANLMTRVQIEFLVRIL